MSWIRFFRRSRWDAERASEIESYIQIETDDSIARGMTPEAARAAARRKFGNLAHVREEIYRMNTVGLLENFARDVAYGLRSLRKSPGFTAVAILSLALGIGANTAIFSLIDVLMLRSLPIPRPHELVQLSIVAGDAPVRIRGSNSFTYPIFEQLRDGRDVFAGIFAHSGIGEIRIDGAPIKVERATAAYFSVLGVEPVLGRTYSAEQDKPGAQPELVISYGYWQRKYGLDPHVLGKTIAFQERTFTIVGVAPRRFRGIAVDNAADIWVPYTAVTPTSRLWGPAAHTNWSPHVVARLKPGIRPERADAPLNGLFARILQNEDALARARDVDRRIPDAEHRQNAARQILLVPAGQGLSSLKRQYAEPLRVLMILVVLVLLIACVNLANLQLARAAARRREIAVRLSIGASRMRLVRQLLTESLILALAGAAAGLLFAFWAGNTLIALVAGPAATDLTFQPDLRILGFTVSVAILTVIVFGLGPALGATRVSLTPALKNEVAASNRARVPLAKILVATQVSLSLVLVLGAVLFVATLQKLVGLGYRDAGARPDLLLLVEYGFDRGGPEGDQIVVANRELLNRVQGLPGVQAATVSDRYNASWMEPVYPQNGPRSNTMLQFVSPNYFDVMRMPLLMGRAFTAADAGGAPKVVVVNETLARQLYPGQSAIGKRVGWSPTGSSEVEIVGVVRDVQWVRLRSAPAFAYLPMLQPLGSPYKKPNDRGVLEVRAQGDLTVMRDLLRHEIQAVRGRPANIRTQAEIIDTAVRQERMMAKISGFFGIAGLLLAIVGLYGLMAYTVSRRIGEMGVRMALGARPRDLMRMVLSETTVLVLAGIAVGTGIAAAVNGLIEKFLFGVSRTDPAMVAIAAALLLGAALLAACVPAMRAARVSPMTVLRHE